jgi:hypothetical protein
VSHCLAEVAVNMSHDVMSNLRAFRKHSLLILFAEPHIIPEGLIAVQ